jgi:hypothetical protein
MQKINSNFTELYHRGLRATPFKGSPTDSAFYIGQPSSFDGMSLNASYRSTSATGPNAPTGFFYALQSVASTGSIQGVEGYSVTNHSFGTVNISIATIGNIEHSGAGTLTFGRSVQGGGILSGNGTMTKQASLFSTFAITGTGVITDYYGGYLGTPSAGSGTITRRWGLYSEDSGAINFFAGKI